MVVVFPAPFLPNSPSALPPSAIIFQYGTVQIRADIDGQVLVVPKGTVEDILHQSHVRSLYGGGIYHLHPGMVAIDFAVAALLKQHYLPFLAGQALEVVLLGLFQLLAKIGFCE